MPNKILPIIEKLERMLPQEFDKHPIEIWNGSNFANPVLLPDKFKLPTYADSNKYGEEYANAAITLILETLTAQLEKEESEENTKNFINNLQSNIQTIRVINDKTLQLFLNIENIAPDQTLEEIKTKCEVYRFHTKENISRSIQSIKIYNQVESASESENLTIKQLEELLTKLEALPEQIITYSNYILSLALNDDAGTIPDKWSQLYNEPEPLLLIDTGSLHKTLEDKKYNAEYLNQIEDIIIPEIPSLDSPWPLTKEGIEAKLNEIFYFFEGLREQVRICEEKLGLLPKVELPELCDKLERKHKLLLSLKRSIKDQLPLAEKLRNYLRKQQQSLDGQPKTIFTLQEMNKKYKTNCRVIQKKPNKKIKELEQSQEAHNKERNIAIRLAETGLKKTNKEILQNNIKIQKQKPGLLARFFNTESNKNYKNLQSELERLSKNLSEQQERLQQLKDGKKKQQAENKSYREELKIIGEQEKQSETLNFIEALQDETNRLFINTAQLLQTSPRTEEISSDIEKNHQEIDAFISRQIELLETVQTTPPQILIKCTALFKAQLTTSKELFNRQQNPPPPSPPCDEPRPRSNSLPPSLPSYVQISSPPPQRPALDVDKWRKILTTYITERNATYRFLDWWGKIFSFIFRFETEKQKRERFVDEIKDNLDNPEELQKTISNSGFFKPRKEYEKSLQHKVDELKTDIANLQR